MTIKTILCQDAANPVELQAWFDENPGLTISTCKVFVQSNMFYVVY